MTLTKEQLTALSAPFPIEAHTVREGFRNNGKTKIRWFVYIDVREVTKRLTDVLGSGWSTTKPEIVPLTTGIIASIGITITGETRWYTGGQDFENTPSSDDGKGAVTDAIRRAASLWGVAEYIYDMDAEFWTDSYEKGKWDDQKARKSEATKKFTEWYNRQFKQRPTPTPPPAAAPAAITEHRKTAAAVDKVIEDIMGEPEPDYSALEIEARKAGLKALDGETVTITKAHYNARHNGTGNPRWDATASVLGGGTVPLVVWTEGETLIKKAGYDWPRDSEALDIPVITKLVGSDRHVISVLAIDGVTWYHLDAQNAANANVEAKNGKSEEYPAWLFDRVNLLYQLGQRPQASAFTYAERGATVDKMNREGCFDKVATLDGAVGMVLERLKAHRASKADKQQQPVKAAS